MYTYTYYFIHTLIYNIYVYYYILAVATPLQRTFISLYLRRIVQIILKWRVILCRENLCNHFKDFPTLGFGNEKQPRRIIVHPKYYNFVS